MRLVGRPSPPGTSAGTVKELPFSQAAQNNREPILRHLQSILRDTDSVLEIGSGTGQHAAYFARALPDLRWQASERAEALPLLLPRLQAETRAQLPDPLVLDIAQDPWRAPPVGAIYTANTLHIVSEALVEEFFRGCSQLRRDGTQLIVYGPFNYGGRFTTESNARFDDWLKERDPASGIRDFEWVDELAQSAGFRLCADEAMPANNRLLHWRARL